VTVLSSFIHCQYNASIIILNVVVFKATYNCDDILIWRAPLELCSVLSHCSPSHVPQKSFFVIVDFVVWSIKLKSRPWQVAAESSFLTWEESFQMKPKWRQTWKKKRQSEGRPLQPGLFSLFFCVLVKIFNESTTRTSAIFEKSVQTGRPCSEKGRAALTLKFAEKNI